MGFAGESRVTDLFPAMIEHNANSNSSHAFRFGIRSLFVTLGVLAVLFASYGWFHRRILKPHQESATVQKHLESLVTRRPKEMSRRQWESAVAWTLNLHHNSLIMFQADGPRFTDSNGVLKLAGDVDMATVHWIWDEYAAICSGGANYQRFRAQMVGEIESGGRDWGRNVP
jgi:hypothetical protein